MNQTNKRNGSWIRSVINFFVNDYYWSCGWGLTSYEKRKKCQFPQEEIQIVVKNTISNVKEENRILGIYSLSKKLRVNMASILVAIFAIFSPGVKCFANAKGSDFTKTSEAQYWQKTQVINVDESSISNDTSKSLIVRKPSKVREQEWDIKNAERSSKGKMKSRKLNEPAPDWKQKNSENNMQIVIVPGNSSFVTQQKQQKSGKIVVWETGERDGSGKKQNMENANRFHVVLNPKIDTTKQTRKQLRKALVKRETFKRNLIQFQNRQRKYDTLNLLIILIVPILNRLYPIFCIHNKNKKQKKLIQAVTKLEIHNKKYVGITEFLQLLENRRHIDKLVANYETIMLFSIFMTACQLKFNASGLLVNTSEPFISVETRIEDWIIQNKILVCLIIFLTVTILTMKILPYLENKKQEYFLYVLKMLEILRKQEQFILQNMSEIFKDTVKDFLLYIVLTFMFNFMISILATSPVTLNLKLNLNENDISLNLDFIDLNKKDNPTKDEIN